MHIVPRRHLMTGIPGRHTAWAECEATKKETPDGNVWSISAPSNLVGSMAFIHLTAPYPAGYDERKLISQADLARMDHLYAGYLASMKFLTIKLFESVCEELFRTSVAKGTTRMGCNIVMPNIEIPDIVLVQISRGGDMPTMILRQYLADTFGLLHVPVIDVSSQRKNIEGTMTADLSAVKGKLDLTGKHVIYAETASASAKTMQTTKPAVENHCGSTPAASILMTINGSRDAVEILGKEMNVATMILHEDMTDAKYLIPGGGDAGRMNVGGIVD